MSKATRISERLFKDVPRFQPKKGAFSPLPWLFRGAMSVLPPRTWQIYTYLVMRAGPEGICWPTDKQIGHDCGIGVRKVTPHLKQLTSLGLVVSTELEGLNYFCIVDAITALQKLVDEKRLPESVSASVSDDLSMMTKQRPVAEELEPEKRVSKYAGIRAVKPASTGAPPTSRFGAKRATLQNRNTEASSPLNDESRAQEAGSTSATSTDSVATSLKEGR